METQTLRGVRVAVLAADGYERVEVTRPLRALRKQGADVRVISLRPGRIRGVNFLWPGRKLAVDDTVFSANPADYGALLLPGGLINPDLLRQSDRALEFVREMDRSGKPIAALCHGPQVLISAGLLSGRRMTSWPGIRTDVQNAGATWEDTEVVRDRNWICSRGPQDLKAFNEAMVALFAEQAPRGLPALRRRVRWVARLMRLGTVGAAAYAGTRLVTGWRDQPSLSELARLASEAKRERSTVGERIAIAVAAAALPFASIGLSLLAKRLRDRSGGAVERVTSETTSTDAGAYLGRY